MAARDEERPLSTRETRERARKKAWRAKNPEWQKQWNRSHPATTRAARIRYLSVPKNAAKQENASRRWRQSEAGKARLHDWYLKRFATPEVRIVYLVKFARARARKAKLDFDDRLFSLSENPPKRCRCCGNELDYFTSGKNTRSSRTPSIDRIDSSLGYTIDNVAIICWRCNNAKGPATLDELRLILAYVEREMRDRRHQTAPEPKSAP